MMFNKIKKLFYSKFLYCGSISGAKNLIKLAAKSGADAVKFQTIPPIQ